MSSLRVTSHNPAHGDQAAEAGRGDAPTDGGSFAAALGTAAGTKGSDAAPLGGGGDGSEGGSARKRASGSGNSADAAAILAASAPPVVVAPPVSASPSSAPDTQTAGDKPAAAGALAVTDALNPAAIAGVIDPGSTVGLAAGEVPSAPTLAPAMMSSGTAVLAEGASVAPAAKSDDGAASALLLTADPSKAARGQQSGSVYANGTSPATTAADSPAGITGDAPTAASLLGPVTPAALAPGASLQPPAHLDALTAGLPILPVQPSAGAGVFGAGLGRGDRYADRSAPAAGVTVARDAEAAGTLNAGGAATPASASPAAADASAPVSADLTDSIAGQVSGHLLRLVSSGSREMVMRLHPPELGDLTVRIAVSGRDVSAWFESAQAQVQAAVSGGIAQLHADLGNAGYNLSGAWVGADASNARQQEAASPAPLPPGATPAAPGFASSGAVISPSAASGVSIYV
jgi:hypothetical protein